MALTVLVVEPGRAVRRVALTGASLVFGSLRLSDVPLDARGVAPRHADLSVYGDDSARVRLLAPDASMRVNGRDVRSATVRAGDQVELGEALLLFEPGALRVAAGGERAQAFATADRIFELARALLDNQPARRVLARTLEPLMELFGAARALILALDRSGKAPRVVARQGEWRGQPAMSRTLLARAVAARAPVLVADVHADPETSTVKSLSVEVRSVVAGPLIQKDVVIGVVYLESPREAPAFGEPERRFLERFSGFASELLTRAAGAEELRAESDRLLALHQRELEQEGALSDLIGTSAPMKEVRRQVRQVAATDVTTLVLGESGTGKELVARAIHRLSGRADRPFVAVNCTALPENLVESELFGHVAGAFSGALRERLGRFELASTGTLFLDEIGDLSPAVQVKLLRVLQERVITRLGENRDRPVDVRIVAATNAALPERIVEGLFREDLFFRLSVYTIALPSLRERAGDVPELAEAFVRRFAREIGKPVDGLDRATVAALSAYGWPGNVRELANLMQQAVVREPGTRISPASLVFALAPGGGRKAAERAPDFGERFELAQARFELWFLERALRAENGDVARVLARTGLAKATFYRRCAALGIDLACFRREGGA